MENKTENNPKTAKVHAMSAEELVRLREEMHLDMVSMAAILVSPKYPKGMPYRTLQDYAAGKRGIPKDVADLVRQKHNQDREFMAGIGTRVDNELRKKGGLVPNLVVGWD